MSFVKMLCAAALLAACAINVIEADTQDRRRGNIVHPDSIASINVFP